MAGNTRPTSGTRIVGRYEAVIARIPSIIFKILNLTTLL
jgi:hypothetical protein